MRVHGADHILLQHEIKAFADAVASDQIQRHIIL
jgi:hypothetical protein